MQFIGERLPYGRLELLILDVFLLLIQTVYHSVMCVVDDSEILAVKIPDENPDPLDRHVVSDGYNGDVMLMELDLIGNVKKVMAYENHLLFSRNTEYMRMPGSYAA